MKLLYSPFNVPFEAINEHADIHRERNRNIKLAKNI